MRQTQSYQVDAVTADTVTGDAAQLLSALASFCTTTYASVPAAIEVALDVIMRRINVGSAFVSNIAHNELHILDAQSWNGCLVEPNSRCMLSETFCQFVRAEDAPIIIPDVNRDSRTAPLAARQTNNIGSYLGVPLYLSNGSFYGTVCVLDPLPRSFSEHHVAFLRVIAQHLGHLIERERFASCATNTVHLVSETTRPTKALPLLNVVAHDIRTPLASIRGYAELLSTGLLGDVTADQQQAGERILDAVQWINRLVNDLLDAAATDGEQFMLVPTSYRPETVLTQIVDMCRVQAHDRNLRLEASAELPLPQVVGDVARVKQILLNYLSNALRYTAQGSISVQARTVDGMVEYCITDTGPGISDAKLPYIWKRNVRATAEGPGVGLGLYVVQRLATSMGGMVGVETTVGKGSSFWVRFPLANPARGAVPWNGSTPKTNGVTAQL